jgi:hypothetical protein
LREQGAALAVGLVISSLQGRDVLLAARGRLGLEQPIHRLGVLAEFVEHDAQKVERGKPDIRRAHIAFEQIAQGGFGFGRAALAMEEEGEVI